MSRENLNTMLSIDSWTNIWDFKLCLRSHDNPNDITGQALASYVMTDKTHVIGGITLIKLLRSVPEDWDKKLINTLEMIKGFDNSDSRYLFIIGSALLGSNDYPGCFPKTTARIKKVYNRTSQAYSCEELYKWVLTTISNINKAGTFY